jgi:heme exporter protein B
MTADPPRVSIPAQALSVFRKDLRSELRRRTAVYSILLFAVVSMAVVGFTAYVTNLPQQTKAALLWIVQFFAAFSGLAHVFLHEEEGGTVTALRITCHPNAVLLGKTLFTLALLLLMSAVTVPAMVLLLAIDPIDRAGFILSVLAGLPGLAACATVVAAILARSQGRGALYGALGLPLLLPHLFIAVSATKSTLMPVSTMPLGMLVTGLLSYAVMLMTTAWLVFPEVWRE